MSEELVIRPVIVSIEPLYEHWLIAKQWWRGRPYIETRLRGGVSPEAFLEVIGWHSEKVKTKTVLVVKTPLGREPFLEVVMIRGKGKTKPLKVDIPIALLLEMIAVATIIRDKTQPEG
jgi:hypothetical protein